MAVLDLPNSTVEILIGDVLDRLAGLEPDSVDCVVTSPPYWGLRDYGVDGQIGLEPSLGEHLGVMVEVFEAVKRVLKPAGTLWLNYGDCYATTPNGRSAADTKAAGGDDRTFRDKPFSTVGPINPPEPGQPFPKNIARRGGGNASAGGTLKPKDLCMMPARVALALHEAGWWIRANNIWGKPNPMPDSSGRYRPATAHEQVFLFAKDAYAGGWWSARDTGEVSDNPDLSEKVEIFNGSILPRWITLGHYYNANAVRVARATACDGKVPDGWDTGPGGHGSVHRNGREKGCKADKQRGHSRRHAGFNNRWDQMSKADQQTNGRHLRNCEPETGITPAELAVWDIATRPFKDAHFATFPPELAARAIAAGCPEGGIVLDPFGGAGTTGLVAARLKRHAILIELNPEYAEMAMNRIAEDWMGDDEARASRGKRAGADDAGPLFEEAG